MAYNLNTDDARAVDLLLDRDGGGERNGPNNAGSMPATFASGHLERHIAAAAKLLDALHQLPAPEPPRGLAARCMRSIARAQRKPASVAPAADQPTTPAPPPAS